MASCSSCKDGAGTRRTKIKIQERTALDDGHGGQDTKAAAWTDKLEVFASMRQKSGTEKWQDQKTISDDMYVFSMFYPQSVTVLPTDRVLVVDSGLELNIRRVNNVDQRNRKLEITAETGRTD